LYDEFIALLKHAMKRSSLPLPKFLDSVSFWKDQEDCYIRQLYLELSLQ